MHIFKYIFLEYVTTQSRMFITYKYISNLLWRGLCISIGIHFRLKKRLFQHKLLHFEKVGIF